MRMGWSGWGWVAGIAGAACVALYAGVHRGLRRALAEQQESNRRQIAALSITVKALQARVAELNDVAVRRGEQTSQLEAAVEMVHGETPDELRPETLAVIAAAATTFAGKPARIRSARSTASHAPASAWTQQGRMIVQTSHNLNRKD
jgi:hypothetical protein